MGPSHLGGQALQPRPRGFWALLKAHLEPHGTPLGASKTPHNSLGASRRPKKRSGWPEKAPTIIDSIQLPLNSQPNPSTNVANLGAECFQTYVSTYMCIDFLLMFIIFYCFSLIFIDAYYFYRFAFDFD